MRVYGVVLVLVTAVSCGGIARADEPVDFNRDIRPIFSAKCFQCHGPDDDHREAHLRLDSDDGKDGLFRVHEDSQAVKPKDLKASAVWQRITTKDVNMRMPPADSEKKPLTDTERELIRRWILQGAEYKTFWAFVPAEPQPVPDLKNDAWSENRIDNFVMRRLEKEGLRPQGRADKRTLIRRLSFDLTGLPPSVEEIRRFLDDAAPGAYRRLVDRFMAKPQYGEHMAKYWLDLVRFADTNGIHHDHYREMTPYRDWVIRAFNQNVKFDDFVTYQLAGDLLPNPTIDQKIASGFNRLHLVIDRGTALPEESFTRNVIDRVSTVGTAFMGLTVGCAVCHDHKYDPLTQRDFFQLYAFFNNIDATPETPGRNVHAPFIRVPDIHQRRRLKSIESRMAEARQRIDRWKQTVNKAEAGENKKQAAVFLKQAENELQVLVKEKKQVEDAAPVSLIMKERAEVRPTHVLIRGAYDQPGQKVDRNTPAFLPPLRAQGAIKTRMDLAKWLVDPQHPLTARVTVNRFWQQFFGVGLVKTSEDFGTQSQWPSHLSLLDDLTVQFIDSQWDVKKLVRSMVLSQTYQQSSSAPPAAYRADPENRRLSRGSRFRLDSEMIRDQILATSGILNSSMYGRSVKPPQPPNLWKTVSMVSSSTYSFQADTGDKIYRRSVYSFWKRAMPPPQMTIFDAPTRESCIARRERTNTPLQALVLMNEQQYFQACRRMAEHLVASARATDDERLTNAYESIVSHQPDDGELKSLRDGLASLRSIYRQDTAGAKAMTEDLKAANDNQRIEIAAYTMLINSLFNLDVTKTRQ